jgi:hypothetical protein
MGSVDLKEELQRRIDRKRRDLEKLENELRDAQAYLRALEDTYRLLDGGGEGSEQPLRPGSDVARCEDILRSAGRPLHVTELLSHLGKASDRKARLSLSASLSSYARRQQVFTKLGQNTFGLSDMPQNSAPTAPTNGSADEPPPDFGLETGITDDDIPF